MHVDNRCGIESGEERRAPSKVPLCRLVTDGVHGDKSACGAADQTEREQARFRKTPAGVVAVLGNVLVPDEGDKSHDVHHGQVGGQHPELARIPSRERAVNAHARREQPEFCGSDKSPNDKANDGEEPPGDVVLVHAVPSAETAQKKQREQHPGCSTCNGEYIKDKRVCSHVVQSGKLQTKKIIDGKDNERRRIDRDQVNEKWLQWCPLRFFAWMPVAIAQQLRYRTPAPTA